MFEFTVFCVIIWRNKKDPDKYMTNPHTITKDDISKRIKSLVELETANYSKDWELVSFSHAFPHFKAPHPSIQI